MDLGSSRPLRIVRDTVRLDAVCSKRTSPVQDLRNACTA